MKGLLSVCPACKQEVLTVDLGPHIKNEHEGWPGFVTDEGTKLKKFKVKPLLPEGSLLPADIFKALEAVNEPPMKVKSKKAPAKKKVTKKKAPAQAATLKLTGAELALVAYLARYERDWIKMHRIRNKGELDPEYEERLDTIKSIEAKIMAATVDKEDMAAAIEQMKEADL